MRCEVTFEHFNLQARCIASPNQLARHPLLSSVNSLCRPLEHPLSTPIPIRNISQTNIITSIHRMPHEIFMTAVVADLDAAKARSVLTGVTETRERHRYTKVRHLHRGDAAPKSLDKLKELGKEPRNPNAPRWQELHQILLAQSYILQERVDITVEVLNRQSGFVISSQMSAIAF